MRLYVHVCAHLQVCVRMSFSYACLSLDLGWIEGTSLTQVPMGADRLARSLCSTGEREFEL